MYRKRRKKNSPEQANSLTAAVYARVSSKEQEEGFSIDAQLALLRGYAAGKGFDIVEEFVESETAKSSGRPEFAKMVTLIRSGKARAIIVEKTDRLYRNLKDRVTLDELGAEIHLVKESTVLSKDSKSHEKFIHDIKVVVAKNYIDNLSEEVKKGMHEKARQGFYPSFAPLGYLNAVRDGQRIIVPDPERAPIITKLFQSYANGDVSLKQLGTYATLLGLRTRKGQPVHHSTVQYMLTNPVYVGVVEWNGERFPGRHEAIVDRTTFDRAQMVMNGRTPSTLSRSKKEFAYSGLVKCSVCGCLATPYQKKGKYIYYACSGAKGCRRQGIREERLNDAIAGLLEGLTIDPAVLVLLRRAIKEIHTEQRSDETQRQQMLVVERDRLNEAIYRLYDDRIAGKVPDSVYDRKLAEWQASLVTVTAKLSELDQASAATWEDSFQMLDAVSNSAFRFKTANSDRKREMAKNLLSNFSIEDGKPVLELRPWFKMVAKANAETSQNPGEKDVSVIWWAQLDSN